MEIIFIILAALTLGSAIAAMSLRNLVHCALCLVVTFAGLACLFLQLKAEFVGFVQVLVYVGAVSILVVFAILLTRGGGAGDKSMIISGSWLVGILVSVLVLGGMIFSIVSSGVIAQALPPNPNLTVKKVGEQLMTKYVLPLEIIALLLTAAMIGAVIIAMREPTTAPAEKATDAKEHE
jgi:NADH:ubiquinone oxidoreductase subunit 6 (subunit J)